MTQYQRKGQISLLLASGCLGIACLASAGIWQMAPCEFEGQAQYDCVAEFDIPYEEFRTILVRNNATRAIVEHGGMEVVDEKVIDIDIDFSQDRRPLMNALKRKSKTIITAERQLVVDVRGQDIEVGELTLTQTSKITPKGMVISTAAMRPTGELIRYETLLSAEPQGEKTRVRLSVEFQVGKEVCRLFHEEAQARLDQAAEVTVREQLVALHEFVTENNESMQR